MNDIVYAQRLFEMLPIWYEDEYRWDGKSITISDVKEALRCGVDAERTPYGDTYKHPPKMQTKEYHIKRVLWFVQHPEEIKDIEIDNLFHDRWILPSCVVVDGNHRLMAAKVLGINRIPIIYCGRLDILDYLLGNVDSMPDEII